MTNLHEVQEALCQFIINATKKGATDSAVHALPEATKELIELTKFIQTQKPI